jgi:quercetin dioxygenase-like cupin family protein
MHVERWEIARDGELTESALRKKLERMGYSVSRYFYPPGTYFPDHSHGVDKIDAVVSGTFRITTEEGVVDLGAGDAIRISKGARHSAEVVGDQAVVSLDAVKVG